MSESDRRWTQPAGVASDSPISQPQAIEIQRYPTLVAVLDSLGIGWSVGRPPNGMAGTIRVRLDREGDFLLEQVIGQLSDLRWRYTPGRTLQLEMNFNELETAADGESGDDPH